MRTTYRPTAFTRRTIRYGKDQDYARSEAGSEDSRRRAGRWRDLIGRVLLEDGLVERGFSRDSVEVARKASALLACRTRDGVWVYPLFQFQDERSGDLLPGLHEVLQEFQDMDVDGWAIASWLRTPLRGLNGASPIGWLREGRESELVRALAADQAREWQH